MDRTDIGLNWLRDAAMDRELSSGIFNTLVLIWLDCWDGSSFRWSRPLSLPDLADHWDVHRSTVWRHIERLSDYGWVEVDRINPRLVRVRPSVDALNLRDGRDSATRLQLRDGVAPPHQEEESISLEILSFNQEIDSPLPGAEMQHGRTGATRENSLSTEDRQRAMDLLVECGVFKNVAHQILSHDYVDLAYVEHWVQYIKTDKERGTGFMVSRMQSGDPVPDFCRTCGGIGGKHRGVYSEHEGFLLECPKASGMEDEDIQEIYGDISEVESW